MEIITKITENNLLLFNFYLKKIYPSITLIIGIMKYPKLASIILSYATAYIHTAQFVKIKKPDKNNAKIFFLSKKAFLKTFHLEKKLVVKINIIAVQIHL